MLVLAFLLFTISSSAVSTQEGIEAAAELVKQRSAVERPRDGHGIPEHRLSERLYDLSTGMKTGDLDNDGKISKGELEKIIAGKRVRDYHANGKHIASHDFGVIDVNNDGKVTKEELVTFYPFLADRTQNSTIF